ncbi:hypothetical protein SLS55_007060 [Diplodia seriata]|uniref:Uncharacterized protein n=1 Tax=Diplodia seriata TaxID=420778 RepID=A0ABR3CB66_9PEZI
MLRKRTPAFQTAPPTAHPIYQKYGHVLQDAAATPGAPQHQQAWPQPGQGGYQDMYTTTPQQQIWQAPAAQQPAPVSPMQHSQQPYATPHTPVNQLYSQPPHVFQSPAPLNVPSVSPPPYNWAQPPSAQAGPAPSDYFQRNEGSTTPQPYYPRPPSQNNNNTYNPPVSPPVPTVSPLDSRQGSVAASHPGMRDRHDTVSSISTAPAHERQDTFSTVSACEERPLTPKAEPKAQAVGDVGSQWTQSGANTAAGSSASALGFGGPGGWEYYAAPGEEDDEEEEITGESKAEAQTRMEDHAPVSPVELPSDPPPFAMKPTATEEPNSGRGEEDNIFELPADFVMEPNGKPDGFADQDATVILPKPSTRYNRIPRPQDLIPDLGPWYASSLERYISMLKTEAYASSDEQRAAAFMEFVATESKARGIPYYAQPPGDGAQQESGKNGERRPKLPLEIPPSGTATEVEVQYSPGGRPMLRAKQKDSQNTADEGTTPVPGKSQQQAYKPFRQGQSTADSGSSTPTTSSVTANQQRQYKPYTPGTPTVEAIRRDSLPRRESFPRRDSFPHRASMSSPIRQEHSETFFPAPLAPHGKRDRAASSSAPQAAASTVPPVEETLMPESSLPYPTTPSHTPPPPELPTKPPPSKLAPAPLALSSLSSARTAPTTGAAHLRALLAPSAKPPTSSSSPSSNPATRIETTLSTLPSLPATKAHIATLNSSFSSSSQVSPTQQAKTLHASLSTERGEQQVLNDMAFEANELTYPQLMGRDEALKREDAERVAAAAGELIDRVGKQYREWEEAVFAGVYGRVREEVERGVEGLAVVEDVGAGAVGALEGGGGDDGAAAGLVKINARTGEIQGLKAPAQPPASASATATAATGTHAPASVSQTLSALTVLATSTRALLTLHAHISARHALLAATVADRDARYAAAETAPLEFIVAFDECENPHPNNNKNKASSGNKEKDGGARGNNDDDDDDDDDARKKLLHLRKHFTAARLGAAARAAADEEVRARQTWQRIEGWMAAGSAAAGKAMESLGAAVKRVDDGDGGGQGGQGVGELLDRAEAVVGELAGRAEALVRCFYEAEVVLNEAEFAVSVEEARMAVFEKAVARGDDGGPAGRWGEWEREAESVVGKLEEERRKEDGVLKEELESRLRVVDTEQKAKAMEVVRRVRTRVVGREEFGDEDRLVGWVS